MRRLFLIIIGMFCVSAFAQVAPQKIFSKLNFVQRDFTYVSNFELNKENAQISEAIIVVHGSALSFENYFNTMQTIADRAQLQNNILVISPHYRTLTENPLAPASELIWTDEGWLSGDSAMNADVSSFAVIDQFMRLAGDKKNFPNLKSIVLTGHSAGGQLTQRYAVGTRIESEISNTHIRYVVSNPGSYMYLNNKRLDLNTGLFTVPRPQQPACLYDEYKYGMDQTNKYMNLIPRAEAVSKYIQKNIIYLIGEADVLTEGLDLTCSAVLQGPHRYLRGVNFKKYMDTEFPTHVHELLVVPGVGHSQRAIYTSEYGMRAVLKSL